MDLILSNFFMTFNKGNREDCFKKPLAFAKSESII